MKLFLPNTLNRLLRQLNQDQDQIELYGQIIRAFLSIKRNSFYYAFFARNMPALRDFKHAIGVAIENRTFFHPSQTISLELLLSTTLTTQEVKICAEYYLTLSKLWTEQNQRRLDGCQTVLYAVVKSMNLLHHKGLLTQKNFDFITHSNTQARDAYYLLAALEMKHWLNTDKLRELQTNYKPQLGEACLLAISSERGEHPATFELTETARETLRKEAQKNHPIYAISVLTYFSSTNAVIQPRKDLVYFPPLKNTTYNYQKFVMALKYQDPSQSDVFKKIKPKNNFTSINLAEILSLSEVQLQKLTTELHLLQIPLGRFVFDSNFFEILIQAVKHENFVSKQPILKLLEDHDCADPHIILALYQSSNHNLDQILSSIHWLLVKPHPEKQPILRFYFECHAPQLPKQMIEKLDQHPSWRIWLLIDPKSRHIIEQIHNQNPKILTKNFLYHLQWNSLIQVMDWALKQQEKLPWTQLIDNDFIYISELNHANEVMQILEQIQDRITFSFFSFVAYRPKATKIFKEIASVLPILTQANLMTHSHLTELVIYLTRHTLVRRPAHIIEIIGQLPQNTLDNKLFTRLMRDKEIPLISQISSRIQEIDDRAEQTAMRTKFTQMLKDNCTYLQIAKGLEEYGNQTEECSDYSFSSTL